MWIIGIILIAAGVGLFFYKKKLEDKLLNIKYYDQTDIKSVVDTCLSVSKELGSGHFSQMVKISAKAGTDNPLKGEFSDESCVYFYAYADHEFEKLVERKDDKGKVHRNWVAGSDTIGSTKQGTQFFISDTVGKVDIDVDGAELTAKDAVRRFKAEARSVRFSFGSFEPRTTREFKSKGYTEVEENIPLGTQLFVVGELHDRNGSPMISKPQEKGNPYIVSVHSEEKVIGGLEGKTKAVFVGSIACAVIGVALIIANFFVK